MSWRDVFVLYRCELRGALRERTIVVNGILVPIFLYPAMLWLAMTGITFVIGRNEGFVSRVALAGPLAAHEELRRALTDHDNVELDPARADPVQAVEEIRAGRLDALLVLSDAEGPAAMLERNFRVELIYDGSQDRSTRARGRVADLVRDYRAEWTRRQAEDLGLAADVWQQFEIKSRNVASEKQMGAFIMGLMLPMFLVIMVAVGCFFPAVDSTAGERERGTWETLMTVAASRASILTGKYLYVATMGAVAGLLNVAAMMLSSKAVFAPLLEDVGESLQFSLDWTALPVMALGAVLLALFSAAGMMILASFARTFKDGQSMVTPFYMLMFLPVLLLQQPDTELTPAIAAVPVANVLMVVREAISGTFNVPLIGLTVVVELVSIVLCLWLATYILRFEDVLIGSYNGSLFKFLRERLRAGKGVQA